MVFLNFRWLSLNFHLVERSFPHNPPYPDKSQYVKNYGNDNLIEIIEINNWRRGPEGEALENGDSVRKTSKIRVFAAFYLIDCQPEIYRDSFISIKEEGNVFEEREAFDVDIDASDEEQNQVNNRRQFRSDKHWFEESREEKAVGDGAIAC